MIPPSQAGMVPASLPARSAPTGVDSAGMSAKPVAENKVALNNTVWPKNGA